MDPSENVIILDDSNKELNSTEKLSTTSKLRSKVKVIGTDPIENSTLVTEVIDGDFELINKIRKIAGQGYDSLQVDHRYNRPQGWKGEQSFPLPTKNLFFHYSQDEDDESNDEGIDVDIENIEEDIGPLVETSIANRLLDECEKLIEIYRPSHPDKNDSEEVWEEMVPKSAWSPIQMKVFHELITILNYDRLSRLCYEGHASEAILRRVSIEKTAVRLRKLFTSLSWNSKLEQWLHGIIVDKAPVKVLVCYLEAMQVLYAKIPNLVNHIINVNSAFPKSMGLDIITQIITKKSWDPVGPMLSQHRMPKLPRAPVFIVVGTEPLNDLPQNSRTHHWVSLLTELGSVIPITSLQTEIDKNKMKVSQYLDELLYAVRYRTNQARSEFEGRPIILVGINAGSALMCHAALYESVAGIICLSFSVDTVEGRRGRPGDRLLEIKCPILFVIGQCATTASIEDMEQVRSSMRCLSGLIVVGGGDDQMRLSKVDLMREKVTQDIVDRAVINEIGDFLSKALTKSTALPSKSTQSQNQVHEVIKIKDDKPSRKERSERSNKKNYYQERKRKLAAIVSNIPPPPATNEPSPKKLKNATKPPQLIMVSTAPTILRTSNINQLAKMKKSETSPAKKNLEEQLPQLTILPSSKTQVSSPITTSSVLSTPTNTIKPVKSVEQPTEVHHTSLQSLLKSANRKPVKVAPQTTLISQPNYPKLVHLQKKENNTNVSHQNRPSVPEPSPTVQQRNIRVVGKGHVPQRTMINLSTLTNVKYLNNQIVPKPTNEPTTSVNLLKNLTPAQLLDAPIDIVSDDCSIVSTPHQNIVQVSQYQQSRVVMTSNQPTSLQISEPKVVSITTPSNANQSSLRIVPRSQSQVIQTNQQRYQTQSTSQTVGNQNVKVIKLCDLFKSKKDNSSKSFTKIISLPRKS